MHVLNGACAYACKMGCDYSELFFLVNVSRLCLVLFLYKGFS